MRLPDDMQVYLWYKGKYYATTLSQINAEVTASSAGTMPTAARRVERSAFLWP